MVPLTLALNALSPIAKLEAIEPPPSPNFMELILVAVATPKTGVVNVGEFKVAVAIVGEVFITNVVPVPVCEVTSV